MASEMQPDAQAKKLRRNRIILLLCLVLLLCGIGAESYLLIQRAENGILTLQRDPAAELLAAVEAGDFDSAHLICITDFPDGDVPESVSEKLIAQAQASRDAYFSEQTDAETAKAQVQSLISIGIPAVTKAAEPIEEEIRTREMRMTQIQKANASYEAGDYADAFKQYRKLPEDDKSLYPYYKEQEEQASMHLTAQTLEDVAAAEKQNDYDTAVSLIENVIRIYGGKVEFWEAMLSGVTQRQQQYQYLEACRNARIFFDSGEYAKAFDALRSLPDTLYEALPVADTLQSHRDTYFRILPMILQHLLADGDTEQAAQLAEEAGALFPDAEEVSSLLDQIRQAMPKELISFGEPELSDFTQTDTALKGADGKTYQSGTGNLYYSYDGALSGRKISSAVFQLDGDFSKLTLTALPMERFAEDMTVLLEISGDQKEIETYAISRKSGVLHIDLDITGTKVLQISVKPAAGAEDLRNVGVIIADAKVTA